MNNINSNPSYDAYLDKLHNDYYSEIDLCPSCEEELEDEYSCSNCGYSNEPDWESIIEDRLEQRSRDWLDDNGY